MIGLEGKNPEVLVSVRDLDVGYGGQTVVQDVNLALHPGESLAVVGRSGCGKSTLLRCIVGQLLPSRGRAELMGIEVWRADPDHRLKVLQKVGLVFQQGALLGSLTVRDNLALPLEMHTRLPRRVVDCMVATRLAQVGLDGSAWLMPAELSGGMRKRVAVARALMAEPQILLCDEPTSGLDPVVAAGLDELLAEVRSITRCALLLVSHDLASVKRLADRIIMMDNGRVVAQGTYSEMSASTDPKVRDFFQRKAAPTDRVHDSLAGCLVQDQTK